MFKAKLCSQAVIENFSHNEYIEIVDYAESYKDVDRAIDRSLVLWL
jgi:hypothetical protein